MAIEKIVTCIVCPKSCRIKATIEGDQIIDIQGYECRRGLDYAKTEVIDPRRMLTTTVKLEGEGLRVIPVRTQTPIPKDLLHKAMLELKDVTVKPPIKVGDVIFKDIVGSGVDVIATANSR